MKRQKRQKIFVNKKVEIENDNYDNCEGTEKLTIL